jgi:hypothetical protein
MMTGAGVLRRPTDPSADVPKRQSRSHTFDPLFLNELLDEKGSDGGPWIAAASLDHGGDISFHWIIGACYQNLLGHRALLCEL